MSVCSIVSTEYHNLNLSGKEKNKDVIAFKERLAKVLWGLFRDGTDEFYVNLEVGVPFWVAEFVCGLKKTNDVYLNIVVPYEEQALKLDKNEGLRNKYYKYHGEAEQVIFASKRYSDDCYEIADEIMVDESDKIVIIGDESEDFYIARYAKENNVDVEYIGVDSLLGLTVSG